MTESATQGQDDTLRLRVCPGCDYSLETLPAEGVCPECGRGYDQQYVVLSGQGRGKWDGLAGGTWRGTWSHLVWVLLIVWLVSRGWRAVYDTNLLAWGVVGVTMLVVQGYARLFSARDPVMQLWASKAGVAQAASTPEARRAQWVTTSAFWLIFPVIIFSSMMRAGASARVTVPIIGGMVAIVALVWWRRRRRYRTSAGSADAEDARFVPALWPWKSIDRVHVGDVTNGRARVRCHTTKRFLSGITSPDWVVDIDVDCDEPTAAVLRERLSVWWQSGRVK